MKLNFYKYHGAGNDFIIADNRAEELEYISTKFIKKICNRRTGVGSDGLILLSPHKQLDFTMKFYNPDGSGATMCGNGGRCIVLFAYSCGIKKKEYTFEASDGIHKAVIEEINSNNSEAVINLEMKATEKVDIIPEGLFCNTGSPHVVRFTDDIESVDIIKEGRAIRYSEKYKDAGINVNFVSKKNEDTIFVRTYERGVENETQSCGTGVTASALSYAEKNNIYNGVINVKTKGGNFEVKFEKSEAGYKDVWLKGQVKFVYFGTI